ncbi:MAG: LysR family transcriptional regulator [Lachnospiraceae bacterium]|nr:LysR family transcriptional regulator [Lachnospiraceae bacterium]MBQ9606408.1 LysR family transcriptional regulator [Lachnospiraceae bacterium]
MTIQQMLYALTIEECGSMNKAAEKLYIAQSTLTSAVHELEHEAGITIFLRSHKGVIPTPEGAEFLSDIRLLYQHYGMVARKYQGEGDYKRKFSVSTQHYSFAVKAFVEMAKHYDMNRFDLAIRETRTLDVIRDVGSLKSEIGILYMSSTNQKALNKLFTEHELEFHSLIKCHAYVYLWKGHPLAKEEAITFEQLKAYPCLSFEQGEESYYFAEEILSENIYPQTIKATDRATMLNLMAGLNGYTLCSGIISDDQNGSDYIVVPYREDEENPNSIMEIGYITKKNSVPGELGERYIEELKRYLDSAAERGL